MTAVFETEVLLGFSASGGAVWKTKWIIPYIYDYKMSGSIDQGLYTGIAITATAQLDEDEEPFGPEKLEPEGLVSLYCPFSTGSDYSLRIRRPLAG